MISLLQQANSLLYPGMILKEVGIRPYSYVKIGKVFDDQTFTISHVYWNDQGYKEKEYMSSDYKFTFDSHFEIHNGPIPE
jgi:hypothetical protein